MSFPNRKPPCNYCKNRHEDTIPSETQCPSCLTYHDSIVNNVKIVQISVKKEATVDDLFEIIQKKFKGTISDELNARPMAHEDLPERLQREADKNLYSKSGPEKIRGPSEEGSARPD